MKLTVEPINFDCGNAKKCKEEYADAFGVFADGVLLEDYETPQQARSRMQQMSEMIARNQLVDIFNRELPKGGLRHA